MKVQCNECGRDDELAAKPRWVHICKRCVEWRALLVDLGEARSHVSKAALEWYRDRKSEIGSYLHTKLEELCRDLHELDERATAELAQRRKDGIF